MRTQLLGLAAMLATLVGFEGSAAAQATVFGDKKFALQQFEPAPAGDRFFGIPDAAVGSHPLYVNLIGNYALKPLKLQDRSGGGEGVERGYLTKNQLYLHLNGTITLAKRLLINADVPFALAQGGDDDLGPNNSPTPFSKPEGGKLGDLRLGLRFAVVGHPLDPFSLAIAGDVWLPTGDKDNLTSDGRTRVNPKIVMSGKVGNFYYSYNAGFLFRKHQDLGSPEVGNAITYGAGVGVSLAQNMVQVGPELYGNTVLPKDNQDGTSNDLFGRHSTPLEVLLGAKFRVKDFQIGAAAGPGLTRTPGTPQLRALLS
ncbi:MAG: transporter, partial [Myxococcales bacterium]